MNKLKASIEIIGHKFSPLKLIKECNLRLNTYNEKGDIGVKGRFKNKEIPFGYASVSLSKNSKNNESDIYSLLNYIRPFIVLIRTFGAESIVLNVAYYYSKQCNQELSIKEIQLLSEMNISFVFSVYKLENVDNE